MNFDYEYADEIKYDTIDGLDITYYNKLGTTLIFELKEDHLITVSGNLEYRILKNIFVSIDVR